MQDTRNDLSGTKARENIGYHQTLMLGVQDLFGEAAKDGLLRQAEDLIDMMWAMVPTVDKRKIKVYDAMGEHKISTMIAWVEAKKIMPPPEIDPRSSQYQNNIKHKERSARLAQIWNDVIHELGFLYERKPFLFAVIDEDDVAAWELSESGPIEGLSSAKDPQDAAERLGLLEH
jgi:hypothetical protein